MEIVKYTKRMVDKLIYRSQGQTSKRRVCHKVQGSGEDKGSSLDLSAPCHFILNMTYFTII